VSFHRSALLKASALIAIVLSASRVHAVTINAVHDTYISSASPTQSFAGALNLSVGPQTMGLVRFLLTSLPAGTTEDQIAKATLWLFVSQRVPNQFGSIVVYRVTSFWNGTGVTYSTRPSYSTSSSATAIFGGVGYYIEVDITSYVKTWVSSSSSNYGLVILPGDSSTNVLFDSKENTGTSHQPILDIVWAPKPASNPTPTPTTTPYGVCVSGSSHPVGCSCTHILSQNPISGSVSANSTCSVSGVSSPCSASALPPIASGSGTYYGVCCVCN
jgi:hypothetical protein